MALVLIDGFDHIAAASLTGKGWNATTSTSLQTGRFGGSCRRIASGSATTITKTLPSALGTVIAGFALRMATIGVSNIFDIRVGATRTCRLQMDVSNHLTVLNSGGTVVATGTTAISANVWYYVEVKLFVNGASGTVEVHLNGVAEIASTVGNFGSTNVDTVAFLPAVGVADHDDLYVLDTTGSAPRNTFLGDVRVETLYPNAEGNYLQFTPNSGTTHNTRVNETVADDDTSYVADGTAGHRDSYGFADLSISSGTVFAVQTNLWTKKDDALSRTVCPMIRQGGTDYDGTAVAVPASYADLTQIWNQDPTNNDWTISNVNADEFGIKVVT